MSPFLAVVSLSQITFADTLGTQNKMGISFFEASHSMDATRSLISSSLEKYKGRIFVSCLFNFFYFAPHPTFSHHSYSDLPLIISLSHA